MFIRRSRDGQPHAGSEPRFKLTVADSLPDRLRGLMLRPVMDDREALLIERCNWVHSMFMRFSIDVIFLDGGYRVVGIKRLRPFRLSMPVFRAARVLEIRAGLAESLGIAVGDRFVIE